MESDTVKEATIERAEPGMPVAVKLGLLLLGAIGVGALLALGVPRRTLEADGTEPAKPPRADDVPPPADHNGGHHEITPEMIEAAEREKAARAAAAPAAPAAPEAKP